MADRPVDVPNDRPRLPDRDDGVREAARLRYELGRLRDRRPVRAALAVTGWRQAGLRDGWPQVKATLAGDPPRYDVPGPDRVPARPRYPHLHAVTLSDDPVVGGVLPWTQITPHQRLPLDRDRPDLLLVDRLSGWDRPQLDDLCAHARRRQVRIVTVGDHARDAIGDRAALHLDDVDDRLTIDPRRDHRVGRETTVVAVADDVDGQQLLWLAATGQIPVGVATDRRRAVLGPAAGHVLVDDPHQVGALVDQLRHDPHRADPIAVRLWRHAHTHHARDVVVDALVVALDLDSPPTPTVGLLAASRRPELLGQLSEDLARTVGIDVQLTVAIHGDLPAPDRWALPPTHVLHVDANRPLGAVLNAALDATPTGWHAKIDDDDRYGPHHLADLWLAARSSGAEVVGRRRHGVVQAATGETVVPDGPSEERYEDHLPGATMLIRGEVLRALRWRHVPNGVDTELVRAVHLAGGACYSSHRFGFVRTRHEDHTYASEFAGRAEPGGVDALLTV